MKCVPALFLISSITALGCNEFPAGQPMWIRLTSPISTFSSHVGDAVHAVLTQDVACDDRVLIPMGTAVEGRIRARRKVGLGLVHETAALDLEFDRVLFGPDLTVGISARVAEVENARERVRNGVIQGVLSSDTFQGRVSSRLIHLPALNPYSDLGLIIYKATFPIFPEPEIFYPAGTDMRLETTASLPPEFFDTDQLANVMPGDSFVPQPWIEDVPWRTTTTNYADADLLNLAFVGSERQVWAAFLAAGWHSADAVSRRSIAHNFYALLNNSDYRQEPLRTFLLDGKPQDMNWQKSLNTIERRDHLRLWQWVPHGAVEPIWIGSSTHDTSAFLSLKLKGFAHHVSPNVDDERAKVVRDLNFAGCVESVVHVERPQAATSTRNAVGDLMRTDGAIAVVKLKDCQPAQAAVDEDSEGSHFKVGNPAFRYLRREILTFRSDIWRANVIYGIYDVGRKAVNMRSRPGGF